MSLLGQCLHTDKCPCAKCTGNRYTGHYNGCGCASCCRIADMMRATAQGVRASPHSSAFSGHPANCSCPLCTIVKPHTQPSYATAQAPYGQQKYGTGPQKAAPPKPSSNTTSPTNAQGAAKRVRLWWDVSAGFYRLITPFKQGFAEALKLYIPAGKRPWLPEEKQWIFDVEYGVAMCVVCEQFWPGEVYFVPKATAEQQEAAKASKATASVASSGAKIEHVVAQFFALLPHDAARKAYLTAANALHPDKNGGDASKMTLLNTAWKRIEEEIYHR